MDARTNPDKSKYLNAFFTITLRKATALALFSFIHLLQAQELPDQVVEFIWEGGGIYWDEESNWNVGGEFQSATPSDVLAEVGYTANVVFRNTNFGLLSPSSVSEIRERYTLDRLIFRENGPDKAFTINSSKGPDFPTPLPGNSPQAITIYDGIYFECGTNILQDTCNDTSTQTINAPLRMVNLSSSNYDFDREVTIYNSHNRGDLVINGDIRVGSFNFNESPQETTIVTLRTDTGGDLIINGDIAPAYIGPGQINITKPDISTIEKIGLGEVYLGGNNSYTGSTIIKNGKLIITGQGRLPDTTDVHIQRDINSSSPGLLQYLIDGEDSINGLYGNGTVLISRNTDFVIGVSGGSDTNGQGSFMGTIDGAGKLFKRGQGVQSFVGTTRLLNQSVVIEEGGLQFSGLLDLAAPIEVKGGFLRISPDTNIVTEIDVDVSGQGQIRFFDLPGLSLRNVAVNSANGLGEFPSGQLLFNSLKFATLSNANTSYTHTRGLISTEELIIGEAGLAEYIHSGDILTSRNFLLGQEKNAIGQYILNENPLDPGNPFYNTSLFTVDAEIGRFGQGVFIQENSVYGTERLTIGTITPDPIIIDDGGGGGVFGGTGSTSTIIFDDTTSTYTLNGGTLNVTDTAMIGSNLTDASQNRNGELIQNDGVSEINQLFIGSTNSAFHKGRYQINNGSLNVNQLTLETHGVFELVNGSVNAGSVINNSGAFNFTGGILSVDSYQGVLINNGGMLSPGNSPGLTNIVGDYIQNSGRMLIEIAGVDSLDIDKINVTGNIELNGGDVIFAFLDGFLPTKDFTFTFLSSGGLLSIADSLNYEFIGLASGFEYSVANDGSGLTFLALNDGSPVPLPATFWLLLSSLLMIKLNVIQSKKLD